MKSRLTRTDKNLGGVYHIVNVQNNRIYVGSTSKFHRRFLQHKSKLLNNNHENAFLQNDWNKHNSDVFEFRIFKIVIDKSLRLISEQKQLDLHYDNHKKCYNLSNKVDKITGCYDMEARRLKQKESAKNRWKRDKQKLLKLKQKLEYRKAISTAKAKTYLLSNPKGEVVSITNLKLFCKQNKLFSSYFYNLFNGKIKQYKGWTLPGIDKTTISIKNAHKAKTYFMINPSGEQVVIHNMSKYCRENNLRKQSMLEVGNGKKESYKGWTRK